MSDSTDSSTLLPPGWESRYDNKTKKIYFVDNYNRTTTWEDPRPRYRALLSQSSRHGSPSHSSVGTSEYIPLQGTALAFVQLSSSDDGLSYPDYKQHGSLELRGSSTVYPSYSSYPPPPQPAFQLPPTPFSHLAPGSIYQDFGSGRPSPVMGRTLLQRSQQTMETSTTTDEMVAKINATFPTATETHIRTLLKKYHNREAVVMSALQVEKHPLATPGPFSTPPLARNLHVAGAYTPMQMTPPLSVRGTPHLMRGSPTTRGSSPGPRTSSAASSYWGSPRFGDLNQTHRPHHSPKMKLRYLKNIFPKAEETLVLDVLASEENNVIRATEKLKQMGFDKKDGKESVQLVRQQEEEAVVIRVESTPVKVMPPSRMKNIEEKNRMRSRLHGLYNQLPERLIQIAMESADFDEEKARQILQFAAEEKENETVTDTGLVKGGSGNDLQDGVPATAEEPKSTSAASKKSPKPIPRRVSTAPRSERPRSDVSVPKVSRGTSTAEDEEFRSPFLLKPDGKNPAMSKGPNDKLLLADYVTWSGPNAQLLQRKSSLAKGPNKAALAEKRILAVGANKDLCKGATCGLAKGSIYSQRTLTSSTELRGQ